MAERARPHHDVGDHIVVGDNDFHHLTSGWHSLERIPEPIRWTSKAAELVIRPGRAERLFVEAIVWGNGVVERPVLGRVEVEGQDVGAFTVERDRLTLLSFLLPRTLSNPVVQGRIVTEQTWVPAAEGLGDDTRQLGIAVRRIWVA
jgi:hypothetical protein